MSFRARPDLVGVIGGMGPLAGADYMTKVIELTPGERDEDHIPLIVCSCPQIPERVAPIVTGTGPSPLPDLLDRVRFLVDSGAKALTMPCNTAHFWYDDMVAVAAGVPFIHIADAVVAELVRREVPKGPVGLIGTPGTVKGRIYDDRLAAAGYTLAKADDATMADVVYPGIKLVKRNRLPEATVLFESAVKDVVAATGAPVVLLACTEIPVALANPQGWMKDHTLDPNRALAQATVDWALERRKLAKAV